MTAFLIIAGWLACGVASYLLARHFIRSTFGPPWTVGHRRFAIAVSLFGPVSLLITLGHCLPAMLDSDKPAGW